MDFFALKHKYRQSSRLFYALFFLVVLVQSLLLMAMVGAVFGLWAGHLGANVLIISGVFVGLYFVMGMLIARHKTKQGGLSLAKAVGATRLFVHGDTPKAVYTKSYIKVSSVRDLPANYRRYHKFAEQMSIAAGVPLPKLYVLASEMGVNGFVAGFGVSDTVMVLTQGAVDKLTNHELYGLLGHEFGHLIQKDHELNLRMYVMMSMLGWVYDLADVMETSVLGKFDKDYHGDDVVIDGSHEGWLDYLRRQQQKFTHVHAQSHINRHRHRDDYEAQAPLFFPYLIAITPVVLFRLFGVMGMASAEWVKSQFNQQREHLADAISVQLTRSDDVLMALQSLHRHDSMLNNPAFTASMSHFFFANPKPKGEWSKSYPSIDERCDVLVEVMREFGGFDGHKNKKLDIQKPFEQIPDEQADDLLKPSADDCHPLLQNAQTNEQGYTIIQYDGSFDVVRDGKLVVDDDWAMWEMPQQFLPRLACTDEYLLPQGVYLTSRSLKHAHLPHAIISALNTPLSALALVECVMCCMLHETVGEQMDLLAIYWGVSSDDKVLPHRLPAKLLKAVAGYDRRADGLLVWLALRQFITKKQHLTNQPDDYAQALSSLVAKYAIWSDKTPQAYSPPKPTKMLFCALVLSLVLMALNKAQGGYDDIKAHLGGYEVSAFLVLLMFVASTQDNSLILMRHDKITTSIRRWSRLAGVAMVIDDKTLIEMCHQVRAFGVADLAVVVMNVDGNSAMIETLKTAFLFDGDMSQDEYEVVLLASLLWQK